MYVLANEVGGKIIFVYRVEGEGGRGGGRGRKGGGGAIPTNLNSDLEGWFG